MTHIRRRKPEPMGLRKSERIRCPAHLAWVRKHECAIKDRGDHFCSGKIEAAHVRSGTDGALSVKPSDCWSIPLCNVAHRLQHQIGEPAFEKRFDIDMKAIAEKLWNISRARVKYERINQSGSRASGQ